MDAETALNLQNSLVVKFLRDIIGEYFLLFRNNFILLQLYVFSTDYPKICDKAQTFLKEHSDDLVEDVISYTKAIHRKMGIFPW